MNRKELESLLPHRGSMLLLEEARREADTAYGSYHVRGDEWFLDGHFPGNPIVPGVIQCEMLAQSACVLLNGETGEGKLLPVFTGLNNVKFRSPVRPGDTFETVCRIKRAKPPFYFAEGKGFVAGKLCVEAEFSFAMAGV